MKLADALAAYQEFSGKASDIARQLSFAGIAVIWIFKNEHGGPLSVPRELLCPTALLVLALAIDLLQYIWGAFIWGLIHRLKEKEIGVGSDKPIEAWPILNWPSLLAFWLKLVAVVAAYALIFKYVYAAVARQ